MSIYKFIAHNKLQPADTVELACPNAGFPKHYAVYVGLQNDQPAFITNLFMEYVLLGIKKCACLDIVQWISLNDIKSDYTTKVLYPDMKQAG